MRKILKRWLFNKVSLIIFGLIFSSAALIAQTVQGEITDENKDPVIGATVVLEGTTIGTATDIDGKFELAANPGDVLVVSYLGYQDQKITVGQDGKINFSLTESSADLDEIVVVGYGTRKKSHNTGAIAKLAGNDIAKVQSTRVDDALAGKLSGVLIQNQSGEPGADPKIQIRAASSVTGDSGPLIVVDGYPISGNLATVNPNDIKSLEVLKDAASAAIYGSRGANGVILVTTKKGEAGKTVFSYNAYASVSNKYRKNILPTAAEWANTIDRNIENGAFDVSEVDPTLLDLRMDFFRNTPTEAVEDWLFQTGSTMSHNFSAQGGSESARFFASLGYQNTEGVVRTQNFERVNARLNVDADLNSKFKTGLNFNGFISDRVKLAHNMRDLLRSYSVHPIIHTQESIDYAQMMDIRAQEFGVDSFDDGFAGSGADSETPMNSSIYTLQPGDYAHDWHFGGRSGHFGGSSNQGPAAKLMERSSTQKNLFGNLSSYLQYEIIDGLNIRTLLGGDFRSTEDYYHQLSQADRRGQIARTSLDETNTTRSSILSETTLNYSKRLGVDGQHDISAVAGIDFQNNFISGISINGGNLSSDAPLNYALLDPASISVSERDETIARQSIFGRVQYAFNNRYLLSASIRRDGDSRFGANNKYQTFPAVSVGWNVHNESFWNSGFVDLLKLRFSRGSLGTTSFLGAYSSLSLLNPQPAAFGTAYLIPSDIENADLTWQTNTESNFGVEVGFADGRIRIGADYYISDIQDMLISQSVVEILGTDAINLNVGDLRSSGLELEASARVIQRRGFNWNLGANFSTVNTEIKDLGDIDELPDEQYGTSGRGPIFRNYVGGEIGEMWGYETAGAVEMEFVADPTVSPNINSGESYVVDQNNDGIIDENDLVKIGQNTPDFYWGLSSNIVYKSLSLGLQFQGAQGGEVYNLDPLYYNSQWGGRLRDDFDADDDGIADHNNMHYARNRDQTDTGIQDASYLALRNVTLGYNINNNFTNKIGISSLTVYGAATNLLYIWGDDYTSYNPEGIEFNNQGGDTYKGPTTYGVQLGASPIVRSFTLGVNVNF